jgi:hypothetical protein
VLFATAPSGSSVAVAEGEPAFSQIYTTTAGFIVNYPDGVATAFGTPTGGQLAAGKYWRWVSSSGSLPNWTSMTEAVWYPVGTGAVGQQQLTVGSRSGNVQIQFANTSGGLGNTIAGIWTISAAYLTGGGN